MDKVSVIIIGGGGRGTVYAGHILEMNSRVEVVGIAEPRAYFRNRIGNMHHIPEENRFRDWRDLAKRPKFADAVIITTQDRMHVEPALAFAELKYHILIEKPLAPTPEECIRIVDAAKKNGIMLSVCHVLRYSNFTRSLKKLIDEGAVGKVVTIRHVEPVGYWRFAHSYVRGNWRKESESSSMLLAKSIHDLDWICFLVKSECTSVSSFGSLMYFNRANQPEGAADRCLQCKLEPECPYSAPRFYVNRIRQNIRGAYVEAVISKPTEKTMLKALETSPYGRCVFACDNDVVDHQVVDMEFANGATATFTLAGCSQYGPRKTEIYGTLGELIGDEESLKLYSYLTGETRSIGIPGHIASDVHGGGDYNLLESFVTAIATGDETPIVTGADVSLKTHLLVFAAEEARREHKIIRLDSPEK